MTRVISASRPITGSSLPSLASSVRSVLYFAENLVAALGAGVVGALAAADIHQRLVDALLIDAEAVQDARTMRPRARR